MSMAGGLPVCMVRRRVGRPPLQWCQQCQNLRATYIGQRQCTLQIGGRSVAATQLAATARAAKGWAATACGRQLVSKQEPASQQEV